MKRTDYLNWDEYFMAIGMIAKERSKDPNTQVGCCIASSDNRILSLGYNGMPRGLSDDEISWERDGNFLDTKYPYVCHSELNAILNYRGNLEGSKIYVALFPCNECAKAIIQAGIKEVIYMDDKYKDTDSVIASKKMFDMCGVIYRQYQKSGKRLELHL